MIPRKYRRVLATGLVGASLVIAGCGGGGGDSATLSADEFRTQADAICKQAEDALDALGSPSSEAEFPGFFKQATELNRDQLAKLEDLSPPEELKSDYDEALGLLREQQKLPLNLLSINGEVIDPGKGPQDERTATRLGGVTAAVQAALATRIPGVDLGRRDAQIFEVFGTVVVVNAIGLPVNGGQVLLTLTFADGSEGTWSAPVQGDGSFQVTANRGDGVSKLELQYTGTDRFAPTDYDQAL